MEELAKLISALDSLGQSERLDATARAVAKLYANDQLLLDEIAKANGIATAATAVLVLAVLVFVFYLERLNRRVKRLESVIGRATSGTDKIPANVLAGTEGPIIE